MLCQLYLFILIEILLSRISIGQACSATRCKTSGAVGIVLCSGCTNNSNIFLPICSSDLWNVFSASAICTEVGLPGDGIPTLMMDANPDLSNGFLTIESTMCPTNYNIPFSQCTVLDYHSTGDPCPTNRYATVSCSNPQSQNRNGDIKLVNFPKNYNIMGIIEVYGRNGFGTVCNNMFNDIAANVACRQLGYVDGIYTSSALFREGSSSMLPPIYYSKIMCSGNEAKLTHCSNNGFRIHDCNHEQDTAVICRDVLTCSTGDLRLVEGSSDGSSGRVETCLGGIWGTVCSNGWDDMDAESICKSLGYNGGIASFPGGFGPGTGPIWFTDVDCSKPIGNGLSDLCLLNSFIGMTDNCFHDIDAGVYCDMASTPISGTPCSIIVDGFGYAGRLEVCDFDGSPASVCAKSYEDFNDVAATVACVSMGHTGAGYATSLGYFGQGSGPILYSKVICNGQEIFLNDCETELHGISTCNHNQDVGIVCYDPSPGACNDGELMLSSSNSSGLAQVLVCFSGIWGSICGDHWDDYDGEVACRQLGLPTQTITTGTTLFPSDLIEPLWLTNLDCMSFENSLIDCLRAPLGVHRQDCISGGLATISCIETGYHQCSQDSYRLVPPMSSPSFQDIDLGNLSSSNSPSFGRVEICSNNEWISVCSIGFGDEEAMYICSELGYTMNDPMIVYVPEIDPGDSMKIVTFDVSCQNRDGVCDTSIIVNDVSSCQHSMDVGLICNNDETGENDAYLMPVTASIAGFVLILLLTILIIVIIVCMRKRGNYSKHRSEDSNHNQQTFTEMNEYLSPNSELQSSPEHVHSGEAGLATKRIYKLSQHGRFPSIHTLSVSTEHLDSLDDGIVINSEHIRLMDCVGQGEYGIVYKAHLIAPSTKYEAKLVAVKTLKGQFSQADVDSLMEETIRMKQFNHSNVLGLLGVCVDAGSAPYVVLPYMTNGSLLDWLKRERSRIILAKDDSTEEQIRDIKRELLSISLQIVHGMHYLSLHKFIHRDLAARNCMMDEGNTIKVSDFGLSLDIYEKNYFRQEKGDDVKLPIKWMAIESMTDGVFSEKTDVWSFGVTCWEIFSGGKMPYGGLSPMGIPRMLEEGERLDTPTNIACSTEIFSMMQDCWKSNPVERPSFSMLKSQLDTLLTPLADYIDFNAMDITRSQAD